MNYLRACLITLIFIVVPNLQAAGNVTFHAEPAAILAGDRSVICYEGSAPRTATVLPEHTYMEPGPKPNCVKVRPLTTTTYFIRGRDSHGDPYETSVKVTVKPATHIIWFYGSSPVVGPGESFTVCYGVEMADSVRLVQPRQEALTVSPNRCFSDQVSRTTRYTLEAKGPGGRIVRETFLVKVQP